MTNSNSNIAKIRTALSLLSKPLPMPQPIMVPATLYAEVPDAFKHLVAKIDPLLGAPLLPEELHLGMAIRNSSGDRISARDFFAVDVEELARIDDRMTLAEMRARQLASETEHHCQRAKDTGPGYRLWRSEPENVRGDATLAWTMNYKFKVLAPGESAPGSGLVFGPWPAE